MLGAYGTSVVTALTAQNTQGIQGVLPVPPSFVKKQLRSVFSDIGADAVKVGMLLRPEIIQVVAQVLEKVKVTKTVVDPVVAAESGRPLLTSKAVQTLKERLFPLAGLITPNLYEASFLTGLSVKNLKEMKQAARILKDLTPGAVLVTGGHLSGPAVDLFYDGLTFKKLSASRIRTVHTHGTGCTFSAAVATFWGQGFSLTDALDKAKQFITRSIAGAQPLGSGRGPTNPYAWFEGKRRSYKARPQDLLSRQRAEVACKRNKAVR